MHWLLEHLQLLIGIGAAIAFMLNKAKGESGGDSPSPRSPGEDIDQAERTRRIQEEIRRRIAERQAGMQGQPPPVYSQPPLIQSEPEPYLTIEDVEPEVPVPLSTPSSSDWDSDYDRQSRERQQSLLQQLAEAEANRDAAIQQAEDVWKTTRQSTPGNGRSDTARAAPAGVPLVGQTNSAGLRQAVLWSEILGKPVALR